MSAGSKIEWTDDTWNPWRGCQAVSPGCAHCYAEALVERFHGKGAFRKRVRSQDATFNAPLRWNLKPWVCDFCGTCHSEREKDSQGCINPECSNAYGTFHRRRVFCASLADIWDEAVAIEWLADALDVIRRCPNLDFLLLTKRPGNWRARLTAVHDSIDPEIPTQRDLALEAWIAAWLFAERAPANVWIGCTVENQEWADQRIPELLRIPAVCRFVSYEPALAEVDFSEWLWKSGCVPHCGERCSKDADCDFNPSGEIHWIIVGGESGPKARAFNVEWARSTVAQCKAAGVAVFVKQLGALPCVQKPDWHGPNPLLGVGAYGGKDKKGGDMAEWPEDLRVREWPKLEIENSRFEIAGGVR